MIGRASATIERDGLEVSADEKLVAVHFVKRSQRAVARQLRSLEINDDEYTGRIGTAVRGSNGYAFDSDCNRVVAHRSSTCNNGIAGETEGADVDDVNDRIEKSISIAADQDAVWSLISEPGWFVNQGSIVDHRIEQLDDHVLVHDVGSVRSPSVPRRSSGLATRRSVGSVRPSPAPTRDHPTSTGNPPSSSSSSTRRPPAPCGCGSWRADSRRSPRMPSTDARGFDENSSGWESELHVAHDHLRSVVA